MPGPANGVRMYLGNLPPDISEKNIRERLKSFGRPADVDIKHRKDHEGRVTATFAHFTISLDKGNIEKCLQSINQQKWNGYTTKAEVAKESYLQRMEAKRASAAQQTLEPEPASKCSSKYGDGFKTRQPQEENFKRSNFNGTSNQSWEQNSNYSNNYGNNFKIRHQQEDTTNFSNKFGNSSTWREENFSKSKFSNKYGRKGQFSEKSQEVNSDFSSKAGLGAKQPHKEIPKSSSKKNTMQDDSSDSEVEVFWKQKFEAGKAVEMGVDEPKPFREEKIQHNNLLSKFESFSNVWNDTSYNVDTSQTPSRLRDTPIKKQSLKANSFDTHELMQNSKHFGEATKTESSAEKKARKLEKYGVKKQTFDKQKYNKSDNGNAISSVSTENNGKIKWDPSKSVKQQQGEQKRLKSLTERMGVIEKQQETVRKALAGQPVNKKIKFDMDQQEPLQDSERAKQKGDDVEKPARLFEDESEEEDAGQDDFVIRKQFEGKKGEKLLALQSRFTNDSRFRLDSRFAQSDSEAEDEEKEVENEEGSNEEEEQQKQLSILDSILAPHQKVTVKTKQQDKRLQPIVRFDPSKREHEEKYKVTEEPRVSTKKRKIEETNNEIVMPEVSSERFYEVSNNLQQVLQTNSTGEFSLRAMFGNQEEEEKEEESSEEEQSETEEKPVPKKEQRKVADVQEKMTRETKPVATWSETFFFKPGDQRLQEGLQFFQASTPESKDVFEKRRHDLWMAVKAKIRNVAKKKVTFERKLGGKSTKRRFKGKRISRQRK